MDEPERPQGGVLSSLLRHLREDPLGLLGMAILILLSLVAVAAPLLAPYSVGAQDLSQRFAAPTLLHPLGLDELGRDILSRLMFGARISLFLSFVVVFSSTLMGLAVGTVAGFVGGWMDDLVMRGIDI